jgi:hypothetical protein
MKFCEAHFAGLRKAIDERGLTQFVAQSGRECAARLVRQGTEGITLETFEPLIGVHNQIIAVALDVVGPDVMQLDATGNHRCPLCFMAEVHDKTCRKPNCGPEIFGALIQHIIDVEADKQKQLHDAVVAASASAMN